MDEEFTRYLEKVRAHRAELRDSVAAVDTAIAEPIARSAMWRERVRAALAELAHDFQEHILLTEGDGGLYANIRASSPRLATPADRLQAEHGELEPRIEELLALLDKEEPIVDLLGFREDVTTLIGRLVRHRQKGSDLVYEAYDVDIGGSG